MQKKVVTDKYTKRKQNEGMECGDVSSPNQWLPKIASKLWVASGEAWIYLSSQSSKGTYTFDILDLVMAWISEGQ